MEKENCQVDHSIQEQISQVLSNINRRAQELQEDLDQNILLESRIISGKLSSVKGLKKHLSHAQLKKAWYEQQEVRDPLGHDTVTRASLHKQYSL